jgi:hypothetical protein
VTFVVTCLSPIWQRGAAWSFFNTCKFALSNKRIQ